MLLLCEVAVKPWLELTNARYDADKDVKRANKLYDRPLFRPAPRSHVTRRATKGVGRMQPTNWKDAGEALGHDELKGCLIPNGSDTSPFHPAAC